MFVASQQGQSKPNCAATYITPVNHPEIWWTPREDDLLASLVKSGMTSAAIGERLGRSEASIMHRRIRSGLSRLRFTAWTADEDAALRRLWGSESTHCIAHMIGRKRCAVIGRAYRLRLPRLRPASRDFAKEYRRSRGLMTGGV